VIPGGLRSAMVAPHTDLLYCVMSTYCRDFEKGCSSSGFRAIARIPSFAGPIFVLI
jgi:hypothetical protein